MEQVECTIVWVSGRHKTGFTIDRKWFSNTTNHPKILKTMYENCFTSKQIDRANVL
jgi:hypothetical protein